MCKIDEHEGKKRRKDVRVQNYAGEAAHSSAVDGLYAEEDVEAESHENHDDNEGFKKHSKPFSS